MACVRGIGFVGGKEGSGEYRCQRIKGMLTTDDAMRAKRLSLWGLFCASNLAT
eukprot:COSAG05_NODE_2724_length_2726_cov_1.567568_3_plen_53_part_00